MRKAALLLLPCAVVALLTSTASAALVVYEPFDYTSGETLNNKTNGNGQSWVRSGAVDPNGITLVSNNLPVPASLQPAVGNSVDIAGVGNGSGSALRLGLGGAIMSGTVYFSFALRADDLAGSNTTTGGFFIGLNNSTGTQMTNPTAAEARIQARIDPNDGTKYQLGVFNNVSATSAAMAGFPSLNVGQTYYIVAAYTFNSGTNDDVSTLWIDPGSLGAASAPAPTMTATGGTDFGQVASILLRQSPAPHVTLDELRVGTDWASVTAIPEPSPFFILLLLSALLVTARANKKWKLFNRQAYFVIQPGAG